MEEEFQESDVFWPEPGFSLGTARSSLQRPKGNIGTKRPKEPSATEARATRAGQISCSWTPGFADSDVKCPAVVDDDGGGGGLVKVMIPPHVLMARRRKEEVVAYSVCDGNGRTLKGRDLRRVRDAVLRMTGFLER